MKTPKNHAHGIVLAALFLTIAACGSSRGPVDRSLDAAHATNRETGETVEGSLDGPRSAVVSALTFPFRLVAGVGEALFGP